MSTLSLKAGSSPATRGAVPPLSGPASPPAEQGAVTGALQAAGSDPMESSPLPRSGQAISTY